MSISSKLPSKKFIIGLAVLLIVALGLVGLDRWLVQRAAYNNEDGGIDSLSLNSEEELQMQFEALAALEQQDSDGDGLRDWEEALWGTDVNNPDSDGDGVMDGEQIRQLQDDLQTQQLIDGNEEFIDEDFELFVQDTYLTLQLLKQQGEYDEAARDALADVIAQEVSRIDDYKVYRATDIEAVEPTIENRRAFREMIDALAGELVRIEDIELFVQEAQSNTQGIIIGDVAERLERLYVLRDRLARIPVPVTYTDDFLLYINAYSGFVQVLDHLANAPVDPRQGMAALVNLEDYAAYFIAAQDQLYVTIGQG